MPRGVVRVPAGAVHLAEGLEVRHVQRQIRAPDEHRAGIEEPLRDHGVTRRLREEQATPRENFPRFF